ncbi:MULTISPECIES: hypothetical protein [unclassified Neochlamydia]|uniref:hypothetical protein n=1 Tax=unclassified Neochlamydia TaxID=2643326 RepID=UPI001BC9EF2B|nr:MULTISPECIES: hypothetical protein [unclassified Neochlamydia]MBS4166858.1 hypothetical protein [Neochlamydia sp. AcF65]MBS4169797.1 hypothetical protein [Neochlamydia sp. AcF95]
MQLGLLGLDNNPLTSLPAEIGQLSLLQNLNLSNNKLTTLPAEIDHLLNELNLELNRSR